MPQRVRTFSSKDVIRIFYKHLTDTERNEVLIELSDLPINLSNIDKIDKIMSKLINLIVSLPSSPILTIASKLIDLFDILMDFKKILLETGMFTDTAKKIKLVQR